MGVADCRTAWKGATQCQKSFSWADSREQELIGTGTILRAGCRANHYAQGHTLLGGCQTTLDAEAAKAAQEAAKAVGKQPAECIVSYVGRDAKPIHDIGSVRKSQLERWDLIGAKLVFPSRCAVRCSGRSRRMGR